jgi:serine/threonine-protein kinase
MHPQSPGGHPPGPGGPAQHDPFIGQTIGNYVVRQKLGEGGMGSVYLAEHPAIGKKVALKVLHAEFAANQEVVSRFFNEAKAVNDIQHPNIVDIVDYGVIATAAEPMVYFIMEFLAGQSLSDLIRREAPLAPERALAISLQVADALAASHAKGIIHRDLKPDNIMLVHRGRERDFVKLLDFGIAKLTGDNPGSRRTRTGIVMGTPAYMSPEQCEGRGNIDHRTDIYALGIVLYEMITGRVPFTGDGYGEVLVQHLTQAPAAPSTIRGLIPPHVEQLVLKALEKRPEARYPTMEEMMRALADPVGYVEAHGGIAGFKDAVLTPGAGPMPQRLTPTPLSPLTPVPGTLASATPSQPGMPHTPTTLGGSAGQVQPGAGGGKKVGLFIGLGVAVAAIAAAVVLLVGGGDKAKDEGTAEGTQTSTSAAGTGDSTGAGPATGAEPATGSATGTGVATGTGAEVGTGGTTAAITPDAGAAAAAPDAGVAVVAAEKVKLMIESSPAGAMVFVGEEKDPRGKTPYELELDKSDEDVEIKLFLKKYKWEKRTISAKRSGTVEVKLEKERKSTGDGGKGKGTGGGTSDDGGSSDDTLNPFKKKKP